VSDDPLLDLRAAEGFVEPAVAEELPGLRLAWITLEARDGPSPPELIGRLRNLSNRYRGAAVIAMRTKPIPSAYRALFRQLGLDPDRTRIPSEEAAVGRLFHGAFRSQGRLADALLVALVETGVPVWALDADRVAAGGLGIRSARTGERLGDGESARPLPPGTLVVADDATIHAILFGERSVVAAPRAATRRILLYSIAVAGVPAIHVEEAFWLVAEALGAPR
jgi:DNA/RNA-binding domain of Phe-tRNA-synthetase-like protein